MIRFPPRRILVALDASPESARAWEQALRFRSSFASTVEAIHVKPWRPAYGDMGAYQTLSEAQAAQREFEAVVRRVGPGIPVHQLDGDPPTQIARFAGRMEFDLLLMGTRGREGVGRVLTGSVAEAVARASSVPVLVVRRVVPRFRSVLAPLRLDLTSLGGLEAAIRVAEGARADLTLLSVVEPPSFPGASAVSGVLEAQRRAVASVAPNARPERKVAFGDRVEEIVREARLHDLVVLVSHVRRPVRDRLLGTTAERVLRRSAVPVLVVPVTPAGTAAVAG